MRGERERRKKRILTRVSCRCLWFPELSLVVPSHHVVETGSREEGHLGCRIPTSGTEEAKSEDQLGGRKEGRRDGRWAGGREGDGGGRELEAKKERKDD